jgi:hypothetical protein
VNTKPRILLLLTFIFFFAGCASTRFGRDLAPENNRAVVEGLKGKNKEALIRSMGDPDFVTSEKGSEYWGYHRNDAWHLNLYYGSAGRVQASDLVVKLREGTATDAFVVGKGSSVGVISGPLSARG